MQKVPPSAAATGLPETSRRTALAGAAALLATACLPHSAKAAVVTQPEPIIALIDSYRAGLQAFEAGYANLTNAEFDALADVTYRPAFQELRERTPPIQTMAGAIAALQFCSDDMEDNDELGIICPIVNATLAYLKGAQS